MATDEEVEAEKQATEELRAALAELRTNTVDVKSVENDLVVAQHRDEQERLRREIDDLLEERAKLSRTPNTTADAQAAMLAAAAEHQQQVAEKVTGNTTTKPPKAGSETAPAATEAEGK